MGQYCSNKQMDVVKDYISNGMQCPLQQGKERDKHVDTEMLQQKCYNLSKLSTGGIQLVLLKVCITEHKSNSKQEF